MPPTNQVPVFYGTAIASSPNVYTAQINGATPLLGGTLFLMNFRTAPSGPCSIDINATGPLDVLLPTGNAVSGAEGVDGQTSLLYYNGAKLIFLVTPNAAITPL
jgi:hypothetical protein